MGEIPVLLLGLWHFCAVFTEAVFIALQGLSSILLHYLIFLPNNKKEKSPA